MMYNNHLRLSLFLMSNVQLSSILCSPKVHFHMLLITFLVSLLRWQNDMNSTVAQCNQVRELFEVLSS